MAAAIAMALETIGRTSESRSPIRHARRTEGRGRGSERGCGRRGDDDGRGRAYPERLAERDEPRRAAEGPHHDRREQRQEPEERREPDRRERRVPERERREHHRRERREPAERRDGNDDDAEGRAFSRSRSLRVKRDDIGRRPARRRSRGPELERRSPILRRAPHHESRRDPGFQGHRASDATLEQKLHIRIEAGDDEDQAVGGLVEVAEHADDDWGQWSQPQCQPEVVDAAEGAEAHAFPPAPRRWGGHRRREHRTDGSGHHRDQRPRCDLAHQSCRDAFPAADAALAGKAAKAVQPSALQPAELPAEVPAPPAAQGNLQPKEPVPVPTLRQRKSVSLTPRQADGRWQFVDGVAA